MRFSTAGNFLRLPGLAPGTYSVTASRSGYQTAAAVVEIGSGEGSSLTLNLQPLDLLQAQGLQEEVGKQSQAQSAPFEPSGPEPVVLVSDTATPDLAGSSEVISNVHEYIRTCAACHGPQGQGGVGPALAGNANLQNPGFVVERILNGTGRMPAFGHRLSNAQIAAIATHERTAWGNGFGQVTAQQVASQRQSPASQEVPAPTLASGPELYESNCAACHGSRGDGSIVAPALDANPELRNAAYTVSRIVMGGDGMPSFSDDLSSAELAAVASFVRTAWGNDFGPITIPQAQNYHGGSSSLPPR